VIGALPAVIAPSVSAAASGDPRAAAYQVTQSGMAFEQALGLRPQELPCFGQGDAAAMTVQQRRTHLGLEPDHFVAKGRLRHP
jgi:hypothetical protein